MEERGLEPNVAVLKPIVLRNVAPLEINILGVPTCVLNASASKSYKALTYKWEDEQKELTFVFERSDTVPFPTPEHANYFAVALAMFAQKPNDKGELYFRVSDIVRNAGKTDKSSGACRSVKEMVLRYSHCTAHWFDSFKVGDAKDNWHGPFILAEDMLKATNEGDTPTLKRNPGKSLDKNKWHRIQFHPKVVESVKNQYVRFFLMEILQSSQLSETAKLVYAHFFRFSDQTAVYRPLDRLLAAFPWRQDRKKEFLKRFEEWLKELEQAKAIEWYKIAPHGVSVKCRPVEELAKILATKEPGALSLADRTGVTTCRASASRKQRQGASGKSRVGTLSDEAAIQKYFEWKAQGKISDNVAATIDAVLERGSASTAGTTLRSFFAREESPGQRTLFAE